MQTYRSGLPNKSREDSAHWASVILVFLKISEASIGLHAASCSQLAHSRACSGHVSLVPP